MATFMHEPKIPRPDAPDNRQAQCRKGKKRNSRLARRRKKVTAHNYYYYHYSTLDLTTRMTGQSCAVDQLPPTTSPECRLGEPADRQCPASGPVPRLAPGPSISAAISARGSDCPVPCQGRGCAEESARDGALRKHLGAGSRSPRRSRSPLSLLGSHRD